MATDEETKRMRELVGLHHARLAETNKALSDIESLLEAAMTAIEEGDDDELLLLLLEAESMADRLP